MLRSTLRAARTAHATLAAPPPLRVRDAAHGALRPLSAAAAKPGYVTAAELKALLQVPAAAQPTCVDVREAEELAQASIPGFRHFALSKAAEWSLGAAAALDARRQTIVMCQHGRARSLAGAAVLKSAGFTDVKILEGGTEAYSQVDPSVPVYPKYTPTFKF